MKRWFGGLMGVALAAAAIVQPAAPQSDTPLQRANLPDYGVAPELHDSVWLNSDQALRLSDLRGQVVLLEMWTFGCINCIRTLPYVEQWHETYADQGLVVIGNHYPEFSYERDIHNIKDALVRLNVTYPVLQDNLRETWDAYNNRYWPTIYLIDKQGHIRYRHIGEGRYTTTEQAIRDLLAEPYTPDAMAEAVDPLTSLTPSVDALNVRSGPGTDRDLLGTIGLGEVYAVHSETDGWYQINFQGQPGYVFGDYTLTS